MAHEQVKERVSETTSAATIAGKCGYVEHITLLSWLL